ncbi:MAG: hemerythrin domain-containing protein [Proteobacteria bacterium]|nr:hemerythrin domain-containing protein [Pseudomonadota bacterium]
MDAINLLKQDHQEVKTLFDTFQQGDADKSVIATEVCRLLTIHAQIEEEIFYPAVREASGTDDVDDLLDEAEVEHASAKELIAQIEDVGESDDLFEAKVKVLGEYVQHHVKEEEGELFPKVEKSGLDLETIGAELEKRKKALLGEAARDIAPPGTKGNRRSRSNRNGGSQQRR